ncbi:MAG: asparagine synthase (glutamine-hydrolyzing) [Steroidobacteraceae bacterium]|nr:asparagine synthase (glutamine-hydrolyzing) [Steroidobacteraceae bacterium]
MCGITGIHLRNANCDPAVLTRMRDVLAHRGPDDADNFVEGPLGLGHRRLSIIDLGTGHQPMATADGRYTIVFNGEIYNYRELRRELETRGAHFHTQSDTEVILALQAMDGDAGVARLNGIFTYAIWDRERRRLLLARDRAGIKPLYYAQTADGFVFGSEIKALFESGLIRPSPDTRHVAEYLVFRHVAGPENLFSGVLSLPPGHTLAVTEGRASPPQAYWRLDDLPKPFAGDYGAAVETLDAALSDAVRRQMVADVPLGTFCSGGIDSSLVTALAARHAGAAVNTYSVGFAEQGWDESGFARMAAEHCRTRHHEIRVDEAQFAELLPKLIWHHDLPLNFANSVHIYAVSELARRDVKVVLTGEGADELFGGYPRYYIPRLAAGLDRLPAALRAPIAALARALPDHRLRKLGAVARLAPEDRLLFNATNVGLETVRSALQQAYAPGDWHFRRQSIERAQRLWRDPFSAMSQLDFETYLLSILNRQDKMSMATSLESRVPFLDNEIIDLARSLPPVFKQTLRHRKRVLKDVARRYLPAAIVDRRKSGFGVPLALWMRGDGPVSRLLDRVASSTRLRGLLPGIGLAALVSEHRAGAADHSEFLWGALNLGLWLEGAG